jgi:diamine N-acetyltransferase
MEVLLPHMLQEQGMDAIVISYTAGNAVARQLYRSLGFVETGEIQHDEPVLRYTAGSSRTG